MRRTLVILALVALVPVACRRGQQTAQTGAAAPTNPTKQAGGAKPSAPGAQATAGGGGGAGGGSGGAAQAVRGAVNRVVTMHEMNELRLFIDQASLASGRMPTPNEIFDAAKQSGARKLTEFLQEGAIVLTGVQTREGIWAYEKDAPTRGGLAVTASGVERLTPDQLRQQMGAGR